MKPDYPRSRSLKTTCGWSFLVSFFGFGLAISPALGVTPAQAQDGGIQPHRAVYSMKLAGVTGKARVAGVQGEMSFRWRNVCTGWTVEQRFHLTFQYTDAAVSEMVSTLVSWESKDGLKYRFNTRRIVNGEIEEDMRGVAETGTEGSGTVRYQKPENQVEELPAGTVFPSAHTLALLQAGQTGERLIYRIVFDGSDSDGAVPVSAAAGLPVKPTITLPTPAAALLAGDVTHFRLAFFPLSGAQAEPDYEMTLGLHANGIAETIKIDYKDFRISGALKELEAEPPSGC